MVQRYRRHHQECPLRLLHTVAMIRMRPLRLLHTVVVVEAARVVDMSTSQETQVRPVSLVASLT